MPSFHIYARKSIYTGRGDSTENQAELCREYILRNFPGTVPAEITVFEDEGFSGKNMERPGFQQLLASIRQGSADAVVCYRLDRISRNVGDFCGLVELLWEHGTEFICIRDGFNTGTPMGRAMMYISSIFAQLERETIGERVTDNFHLLARTGRWLGGPRPTGFLPMESKDSISGKSAYHLRPIEVELNSVRQAFTLFLETGSLNGTVRRLAQCGAATKSGKALSISSLKSLLRNPVYAKATPEVYGYFLRRGSNLAFEKSDCNGKSGFMTYNRSTMKKSKKVLRGYSEWVVSIGAHDGIIDGTGWARVQELLDATAERYARRAAHSAEAHCIHTPE